MSRAAEDLARAAGPGPVARLDHPLVDEDPVRGRRARRGGRPCSRMWVISRVDRALAVRAADRHDRDRAGRRPGSRPAASLSAAVDPGSTSGPAGAPGRRSGGPSGPATRRARPGRGPPRRSSGPVRPPVHGKVTIQWPGSDERWTARPARPSPWSARRRRSQADERGDVVRPVARRDGARRAGPGRAARARAGRTRSAAGRSATSTLTTGSSR